MLTNPFTSFRTGAIHRQGNLELIRELPGESVDLIYVDPPFFSNQQYEVISETRRVSGGFGGGAEIATRAEVPVAGCPAQAQREHRDSTGYRQGVKNDQELCSVRNSL